MTEQAGATDAEVEVVVEQVLGLAQGNAQMDAGITSQQAGTRADMGTGFTELRGRLDGTTAGLEHITGLLATVIAQQGNQPGGTTDP